MLYSAGYCVNNVQVVLSGLAPSCVNNHLVDESLPEHPKTSFNADVIL